MNEASNNIKSKQYKTGLQLAWLIKMAWRDSRRNRSRLLLFVSSIILGIAALVAIYSFKNNLLQEIDNQAATLIGADLEISSNKPVAPTIKGLVDSLGDQQSEERRFASMVYFPKGGGSRLIQVRALQGGFPYYGQLETEPVAGAQRFKNEQQALVDKTLMLQYGAVVGDTVKIGNVSFAIAGALISAPGQTGITASVAPVVYIPLQYMKQTGLEQKGSAINYRFYFKYDRSINMEQLTDKIGPRLDANGWNYDTVESQKEDTARSFRDVTRFLSLVGFIALLLGCIGVASAIHIYVREKINSIAVLRCLGAKASQSFLIYLIQIVGIGLVGSIIGAVLGTAIQQLLPIVLSDFLPVKLSNAISFPAVGQGILLGLIISILFALLPLVSIRNVSPLNTLRLSYQSTNMFKDPLKWLVYALIISFILLFSRFQLRNWQQSISFTVGVMAAFLVLAAIASLLMWLVRRFFPSGLSYLWRQGLANLYRPNNQTGILIVSIGLGTAFICTLFFIQSILLNRLNITGGANQYNIVLFDIQNSQKDSVLALSKKFGLPAKGTVPVVNMRLEKVNAITAATLQRDSAAGIRQGRRLKGMQRWAFSREYRVTYRDTLVSTETITKGKWTGAVTASGPIYVSLEEGFANRNHIAVGDTMVFNVQGSIMPVLVGSLRQVEWNRIQTNFLVVFPTGVLEEAPQFHVLLTLTPSPEVSARFQQAVVRQFPNVSIIDLSLVLSIIDALLSKIGFVIRFMAGFSIITGIIVLIASVVISKYQRMQESVLLRTLGASRTQIFAITALEYFFLGAFAAFTGILLALGGGWALARYIFETAFNPPLLPILLIFISICGLTVFIGLINSRAVLTKSPLEILRQEV
jgi:putative ABC transport system permease protein